MKEKIAREILDFLKSRDDNMEPIDVKKLYESVDASKDQIIWVLKMLRDNNYIDTDAIQLDPQGIIIPSDMHRPLVTSSGLEYLSRITQ